MRSPDRISTSTFHVAKTFRSRCSDYPSMVRRCYLLRSAFRADAAMLSISMAAWWATRSGSRGQGSGPGPRFDCWFRRQTKDEMETWDAIRARRNVREYTPQPVSEKDLNRI